MLSLVVLITVARADDPWAPVRDLLETWPGLDDFAFSAGDSVARRFSYSRGNTTLESHLMMASASKFPAAMAIAGATNGNFDVLAKDVWDWWNTTDARSRVTLRSLLTFTSGFYDSGVSGSVPCMVYVFNYTEEECARQIYEQAPFVAEPGTLWDYNSYHLQLAGYLGAKLAGMSVPRMLREYLIEPLGLNHTLWVAGPNANLAAGMRTTGDDYDEILRKYLARELLPQSITDEMEKDALNGTEISNSSAYLAYTIGHYSMCNWFECLNQNGTFPAECQEAAIHMDAGLFGYYPLIDRYNETYFQIVQAQLTLNTSNLQPTSEAIALRIAVKPLVDAALATY